MHRQTAFKLLYDALYITITRKNLLRKETNEIREKLYKKEAVYNFLKEKEQEGSLTIRQKRVLKNNDSILRILKKI